MILTDKVTSNKTQFLLDVAAIATEFGINPNWLMAVMWKESRLNPQAVNSYTGATGLIQFMPATANALGTSTAALKTMSNVEQLVYVRKYLLPYKNRLKSFTDTYLAVFFPAAIGAGPDTVLQTSNLSPSLIAKQNPGMDFNKDNKITVAEIENWLYSGFDPTTTNELKKKA